MTKSKKKTSRRSVSADVYRVIAESVVTQRAQQAPTETIDPFLIHAEDNCGLDANSDKLVELAVKLLDVGDNGDCPPSCQNPDLVVEMLIEAARYMQRCIDDPTAWYGYGLLEGYEDPREPCDVSALAAFHPAAV